MSEPIIRFDQVGKTFRRGKTEIHALENITLDIAPGEIFAFIGFSGAGKSTLVRLINGLETPTAGTVTVHGHVLNGLPAKKIRELRGDIGMVFQQFNLLNSRTVYGNVAYPLELAGWSKRDIYDRITELLHFVGLTERAWAYPEELSGGQKQRVGIARALATRPSILLADEATSALDPDTTRDVLALLRKANDELGTTVVVITHEMEVVRSLADRVAVLDDGHLVEHGTVREIFTSPAQDATRRIVGASLDLEPDTDEVEELEATHTGRLVTVTANPGENLGAVISDVGARGVGLEFVHGGVTRIKGDDLTTFTLNLSGPADAVEGVVAELAEVATVKETH